MKALIEHTDSLKTPKNKIPAFSGQYGNNKGLFFFQPKFTINSPNDPDNYRDEQEADAMADKVMRMPDATTSDNLFFKPVISSIQRTCAHCEEEEKQMQRKEINAASPQTTPPGTIQRQAPAPGTGPVAQPNCLTPQSIVVETTGSEMFEIVDVTPPCYACPNSPPNACSKLASKIFPPVITNPVQFSWQVKFIRFGEGKIEQKTHLVQKIEKTFNFSTPPAAAYNYTSPYWEAFELNGNQTEIDYWQFEIPDLTAGTWEMKGTLYLTDGLPNGMAQNNVAEAQGVPSSMNEPKGLGRIRGTRLIKGMFDFTGTAKRHSFQ